MWPTRLKIPLSAQKMTLSHVSDGFLGIEEMQIDDRGENQWDCRQ